MSFVQVNKHFYIECLMLDEVTNETVDMKQYLKDILVRKRFLIDAFPLYVFDFVTTETLRNQMRDHNFSLSLRISMFEGIDSEKSADTNEDFFPEEETIFEGRIRIYDKPFITSSIKNNEEDDEGTENNISSSMPMIYYRVCGVPEELIEKNNVAINKIFQDSRVSEGIINILSDIDKESKLLIQDPENKEIYRNILIPPSTVVGALHFMDDNFPFYSGPMSCFFDYKKIYLFNSINPDINTEEQNTIELTVLNVDNIDDMDIYKKIFVDNENGNIRYTMRTAPAITNSSKLRGNELGKNSIYYSYDENFNLVKRNDEYDDAFDKTRYFWNPTGLKRYEESFSNTIKKSSKSIGFLLAGINPFLITPLTQVSLTSDYDNINGLYGIESVSYMFDTENFKHYSATINIDGIKK